MLAALTTTVLGMGGPLGFPALRESLGLAELEVQPDRGEVRWVHVTSRIRSDRSTRSQIVGRLEPGDSVRVDHAEAGWYAVFPLTTATQSEPTAIGYVYGELLKDEPPPDVTVPLVRILP
jgi:hypothetical protein